MKGYTNWLAFYLQKLTAYSFLVSNPICCHLVFNVTNRSADAIKFDIQMVLNKYISTCWKNPIRYSKSYTYRRRELLLSKFRMHHLLNEDAESFEQRSNPHKDFYNIRKVLQHFSRHSFLVFFFISIVNCVLIFVFRFFSLVFFFLLLVAVLYLLKPAFLSLFLAADPLTIRLISVKC